MSALDKAVAELEAKRATLAALRAKLPAAPEGFFHMDDVAELFGLSSAAAAERLLEKTPTQQDNLGRVIVSRQALTQFARLRRVGIDSGGYL